MDLESHTHESLHESHRKSHHNQSSRFVLLAVPFLIILLLITVAVSLGSKKRTTQDFPVEEAGQFVGEPVGQVSQEEITRRLSEIAQYSPINPHTITAMSNNRRGATTLRSGGTYSYPNPYFTWSGASVKRGGVKIVGYRVYFGSSDSPNDFSRNAVFQTGTTFTAKNLARGTTYFLKVQTVTNDTNPAYMFGMESTGELTYLSFIYTYR